MRQPAQSRFADGYAYNTYTRNGLPTPISLPGRASLRAAGAAASRILHFAARGDGSSEFSRNLAET